MPIETERKFLLRVEDALRYIPADATIIEIEQAYIVSGPEGALRIRKSIRDGVATLFLTCKGPKVGGSAEEIEFPISEERYAALASSLTGRSIRKTRHVFFLEGHQVEVDIFAAPFEPLCVAEIEGENCVIFLPPDAFGPEVTGDHRYDNGYLALSGEMPPVLD